MVQKRRRNNRDLVGWLTSFKYEALIRLDWRSTLRNDSAQNWTGRGANTAGLQLVSSSAQCQGEGSLTDTDVWNTFHSRDLEAVHEHMVNAFCPHSLRIENRHSPLAFQHRHAQLKTVSFNTTEYGRSAGNVLVEIPRPENLYLVQFVLSGRATFEQNGDIHSLTPGYLSVLNPDTAVRQITHSDCRHFTIKLDKAQLSQILASEIGGHREALAFNSAPFALKGTTGSFARYVQQVCADLEETQTGLLHPKVVGSLEDTLARLLLVSVPHNYSDAFSERAENTVAPYYIKRVEEFVRTRYRKKLSLDDLIKASGVSGRSLHSGFRKYRDTTPMGFLKSVRINTAHAALKNAGEKTTSVTDVALDCGFLSPGKFSQDYKRYFDVSPSVTLKQSI